MTSREGGSVAIVGAGPGDPELVTLKAVRYLAAADIVLIDALAPHALLAHCRPGVEVVDVGKRRGRHTASQSSIETLMVSQAMEGKRVVRLKGGDPFVFGRGGEEALACQRAGIPYDVVPGISSALAAPGWAGIPVTHRGLSQHVTVVSGHVPPGHAAGTVDWEKLGGLGGTVVVLMAMSHVGAIADALIRGGRAADTPAAVIREGTTDSGVALLSTLRDVAGATRDAGVGAPAVLVIGEVAAMANSASLIVSAFVGSP